jgi:two-component system, chemotaxis family, sensor kinase CheA
VAKDAYRSFRVEAGELLEQIGRGILDLEKGAGDAQTVPRLLRAAHTLKGAARVVKQREIADHAHSLEDLLAPLRDAGGPAPRAPIDALLKLLDNLHRCVAALAPAPDAQDLPLRTVRADVARMDTLLEGIAQVYALIAELRRSQQAAGRARDLADLLVNRPSLRRAQDGRTAFSPSQSMTEELRAVIGDLGRGLAVCVDQMDRELRQVRDTAEQLRLVPAASLFMALERTARDVAQSSGKRVVFEGRGGAVRLDAEVLGAVQGALLQMVRNAVAHGIEPEAERAALRKPADGRVTLDIVRQGRRVVFSCTDDGAGVDLDAVRRAAQRKGWLAPTTQTLDAQTLLQLLLRGGISTAEAVTDVSGRGVGLDVVRDAVARLGGEVAVHTAAGHGTTLRLTVPLAIASLQTLVVEAGGTIASIPLDAVRRTLRHTAQDVVRTAQGDSMVYDGKVIPFISLSRLLQPTVPLRMAQRGSAVIIEGAGAAAAIGVDRLVGTAGVVVRPLPRFAPAARAVAGASLDMEGNPQLVLDPDGLVDEAQRAGAQAREPEKARALILVVDDSLTTRMLEQSILESAGYLVHAAVSAEDGLARARRHRYALFLVDVEMPGMDGFTFIEHIRADPQLRPVPAILVTSRSSPEDRRRGQEVGAQGYIVKSEFAQTEFLQRVQQLVEGP